MRALGIYLIAAQHLPYKRAAGLLSDWLGASLSPGTLMAFVKDGADDLDEFLDQVHGVIKQTPARNLLVRLDRDREQVLRFAHDFEVPFDNNLAERDIRMIKIQQKVSGSWRTTAGADRFLALRSYISTSRKQGRDMIDTLARLAKHQPWLPPPPDPEPQTAT